MLYKWKENDETLASFIKKAPSKVVKIGCRKSPG
jgi:hypothetical protein